MGKACDVTGDKALDSLKQIGNVFHCTESSGLHFMYGVSEWYCISLLVMLHFTVEVPDIVHSGHTFHIGVPSKPGRIVFRERHG